MSGTGIASVRGRRVWDSRGRPTVEAEVALSNGATGRAIAPAGASRGSGEAAELRDGGTALGGHGVDGAVANVDGEIGALLRGMDARDQAAVDEAMIRADGTPDRSRLGGNATIAVSLAVLRAAAAAAGEPLWRHLAGGGPVRLPMPEIQIFGGGAHAGNRIDVQDVMAVPVGAATLDEAFAMIAEVYLAAGRTLEETGRRAGVADEGGWWPDFGTNEDALDALARAIERAGLEPGADVAVSLDVAASEFGARDRYRLALERREIGTGEWAETLGGWLARHPIVSIEDPFAEDDEEGFRAFAAAHGDRVQIVGDDLVVTDAERIARCARRGLCNAALIKPNQAGTVTETRAAFDAARGAGWGTIVSARSGETEDVAVAHLAVGWDAGQIKVGSFARSERMAKWNELLRIAEQAAGGAELARP